MILIRLSKKQCLQKTLYDVEPQTFFLICILFRIQLYKFIVLPHYFIKIAFQKPEKLLYASEISGTYNVFMQNTAPNLDLHFPITSIYCFYSHEGPYLYLVLLYIRMFLSLFVYSLGKKWNFSHAIRIFR